MTRKRKPTKPVPAVEEISKKYTVNELPSDDSEGEWEREKNADFIRLQKNVSGTERYSDEEMEDREVFGLDGDSSEMESEEEIEEEVLLENFKKFNKVKQNLDSDEDEAKSSSKVETEEGWGRKRDEYYASDDYSDEDQGLCIETKSLS
jgi:hypothetical protein